MKERIRGLGPRYDTMLTNKDGDSNSERSFFSSKKSESKVRTDSRRIAMIRSRQLECIARTDIPTVPAMEDIGSD
jgi:hypothetical protein